MALLFDFQFSLLTQIQPRRIRVIDRLISDPQILCIDPTSTLAVRDEQMIQNARCEHRALVWLSGLARMDHLLDPLELIRKVRVIRLLALLDPRRKLPT
jgi:hypothetical protein